MAASNGTTSSIPLLPLLSDLLPQERLQAWKDLGLPLWFPQTEADEASLDEGKHWLEFVNQFQKGDDWSGKLRSLDEHLLKQSVICGHGLTVSTVDVMVFVAVRDTLVHNVISVKKVEYQNVLRWFDYVQNDEKVAVFFDKSPIAKGGFEPQDFSDAIAKKPAKAETAVTIEPSKGNTKDAAKNLGKDAENGNKANENIAKKTTQKEISTSVMKGEEKKNEDNTALKQKEGKGKEGEGKKDDKKGKEESQVSVSVLDIRVGLVVKVWKHPSADSLYVEEIDLGDIGVRQVVSGLAKYVKEEDMMNRKVVLIANVKPGKLRDVVSTGLVLCASNSDHTLVEPILPPPTAIIGERVTFFGHDGKPEDVLNPKKKQLEKIFPDLFTDDNGIATYQGVPFMTSAGPCTSSFSKAPIK